MAKIVVVSGAAEGGEVQLGQGSFTAGVGADRDIVLDASPLVGETHASLRFENNRWFVRDEGSVYGTFVNHRRVKEQGLQDGDIVELGLGGPTLRFESEREERERSAATTAGHLKQLYEQAAAEEEEEAEPLEGAGKIAIPVATRGVLLAIGGVALVALGALWVTGRDADPGIDGGAVSSSPTAPGGSLYPLHTASRAYFADAARIATEAERYREGGVRRTRLQEELAGAVAGLETGAVGAVSTDSLNSLRSSLEGRLAALETLGDVGRGAAASVALVQTGFQVDTFYFPGPTGTAFVIGDGRMVTSRHVVEPATYIRGSDEVALACALRALAEAGTPATRIVSVWAPGSTPGARRDGGFDPATATHSTENGSVEIVHLLGGDAADPRVIGCPEGGVVETHHEDGRVTDLALLSVVDVDAPALQFATAAPGQGDMVLLTGFPRGFSVAGGPWVGLGPLVSGGSSLVFEVPVLPGTDGAPILDASGRLVGVATEARNDHGMAIAASHVRALLDGS